MAPGTKCFRQNSLRLPLITHTLPLFRYICFNFWSGPNFPSLFIYILFRSLDRARQLKAQPIAIKLCIFCGSSLVGAILFYSVTSMKLG